jgi:hypothetical protein
MAGVDPRTRQEFGRVEGRRGWWSATRTSALITFELRSSGSCLLLTPEAIQNLDEA